MLLNFQVALTTHPKQKQNQDQDIFRATKSRDLLHYTSGITCVGIEPLKRSTRLPKCHYYISYGDYVSHKAQAKTKEFWRTKSKSSCLLLRLNSIVEAGVEPTARRTVPMCRVLVLVTLAGPRPSMAEADNKKNCFWRYFSAVT